MNYKNKTEFQINDKRLLLIGPMPPPCDGTSIKFGIFYDYTCMHLKQELVDIINTQTGDKALISLISLNCFVGYTRIIVQTIIKGFRADVLVVFGSQRFATVFGCVVSILFGLIGKPVFISIFGGGYDTYLKKFRPILFRTVKLMLGFTRGIIVETKHLQQVIPKLLKANISYVPNFRESFPALDICRESNDQHIRFVYVGVIRREKGIRELLEAFNRLLQCNYEGRLQLSITLDLYGPIYKSTQDYVDLELALNTPAVRIHGDVSYETVLKAYTVSDIFVFPSYWPTEGHSGAVIEALMQGLPVIATNWRANPELIRHNENGLLCPPKDVDALTACMEEMILNNNLRNRLAEGAKRSYSEFDAKYACATLLKILMG